MPRPTPKKPNKNSFLDAEFNLPKLEEKVLRFWGERDIFKKSLAERAHGKPFVFYEGPPYANGKPGIHHVLARVVKDVILRYKTMRGFYVPRRAGWDTHGLPVEMAAEKALGLKSKRDIEKYGIKLFNEKAKEQVWIHKDEWEHLTNRIGYWLDLKNAYVTYAPEYIETIWWTLAQISKRKLLYKGHKVVPWCTRCGTSLSSHELAQGYKEVVDDSVFVKFRLKKGQRVGNFIADDATFILSWTTTPWTLPGNLALAVGEDITYAFVRTTDPKESYIVAKDLAASVFKDKDFAVMGEFPGRRLVGLEYVPLFNIPSLASEQSYKVYPADFVTTTDGTGVVHTAVMYGEDDYALGKKVGLPERHTVGEDGRFTDEVVGFSGDYVKAKETAEKIFGYLRVKNNFFAQEAYTHEYPHCWRCDTPILYYARLSWFIAMSKLRAELLRRNKDIRWMPEHVRDGRFGEWLREVKDWNLSRERYWGAPLPIWECAECGHTEVVASLDELNRLSGGSKNRYWVMRHGEAEGNVLGIIDSGPKHFHLTERGRKQVERTARLLMRDGAKMDLIFSSDVTRAKETAEITRETLGVKKVIFDKRLQEIHLGPQFEGQLLKDYQKRFPSLEGRFLEGPLGGETLRDVRSRTWDFLRECEASYEGKNILIVSHGEPIWMLEAIAAGLSEKKFAEVVAEYIKTGEAQTLAVKSLPRNDAGEVDLHRPFVDEIFLHCPKCKSQKMRRVLEVADVWYDSGAMPLAQAHFPFALAGNGNRSAVDVKPQGRIGYPADYIAEGMDQTRGWFYTMLAIATALGYEAPYKNVITFGLMNDKFGKKMSKSRGNVVDPWTVVDTYGADAVRWYFFSGTPFGEPKKFDETDVAKAFRRMHLIFYNSFLFWKTYGAQKTPAMADAEPSANILDQWIVARLNELIDSVTKKLDAYEIREAALEMEAFIDDLSRWYIRRSRRRLQRPESQTDYAAASATMRSVLLAFVKLLAPFTPFFAEAFYGPLGGAHESVHLDAWPKLEKPLIDKKLIASMAAVRELAALGLAKRAEAGIKVRQPLATMKINDSRLKTAKKLFDILAEEVNVKKVAFDAGMKEPVELDTAITPDLREEGLLREVARLVQELRQKAGLQPKDKIAIMLDLPAGAKDAIMKNEAALRADVGAKSIEYRRSEKFSAEGTAKLEGGEIWAGVRKI